MFSINYRLLPTEEVINLPVDWSCSRGSYSFGRWCLFKELDFGFPAVSVSLSAGTMNKYLPMGVASHSRSESLFQKNYLSITGTDQNEDNLDRSNFVNIIGIWASQVLRNVDGGGVKFPGKTLQRRDVISVTRGWPISR